MSKGKNKNRKSRNMGFGFIVSGIGLIMLCVLSDGHIGQFSGWPYAFLHFAIKLCEHISIGLIAIGTLTMLLEIEHWTDYFEKRLTKIVMNKEYLENIKAEDLINLQSDVLKAYFKNDDILQKEGFLHYYQKNIQKFIDHPYRENVVMSLTIAYGKDESGAENRSIAEVIEILSYTCKKNGSHVQKNICYLPEEDEYVSIQDFAVLLKHPTIEINTSGTDKKENLSLRMT